MLETIFHSLEDSLTPQSSVVESPRKMRSGKNWKFPIVNHLHVTQLNKILALADSIYKTKHSLNDYIENQFVQIAPILESLYEIWCVCVCFSTVSTAQ